MNAYTTKEFTTFYVRALAEHVELGLDILCDILCRPALRPEEVDAERQVILEEVLMHRDEPMDVVQEHFANAMFPATPSGARFSASPRSSATSRCRRSGRSSTSTTCRATW